MIGRPPRSPLFPSPTLFRSVDTTVTGSMTASGVTSLLICKSHLDGTSGYEALRKPIDSAIRDGVGWLASNYSVDRKSTRLNSSHLVISYAVFCLKKKHYNANLGGLSIRLDGRGGIEVSGVATKSVHYFEQRK